MKEVHRVPANEAITTYNYAVAHRTKDRVIDRKEISFRLNLCNFFWRYGIIDRLLS